MSRHRRRSVTGRGALALPAFALAAALLISDPLLTYHRAQPALTPPATEQDDRLHADDDSTDADRWMIQGTGADLTGERTDWACATGWSGCQNFR